MKRSGGPNVTRTQRVATALADLVPRRVKIALRGRRSSPRWMAVAIHKLLDRVPGDPYPILSCSGPLEGYRMKLDWKKHRSFAYGSWEPEVVDAISGVVRPGMKAIDIGAHGGFYALLLSKLVGPAGDVIAFEPLPANFRVLRENLRINATGNITAELLAVFSHSGELVMEVPGPESFLLAGPLDDMDERDTVRTRCISLDEYLVGGHRRVDFIKMDVEGAEGDVLKGAKEVVDRYHPTMMIELHNVRRAEEHPVAIQLQKMGYAIEWLSEMSYTAHTLARWVRS